MILSRNKGHELSIDRYASEHAERHRVLTHPGCKKTAGRALGTIVELITYYLLREWGLCDSMSIERGLPEFGDEEICHNVEFTLHPVLKEEAVGQEPPLTAAKIMELLTEDMVEAFAQRKSNKLLDANNVLRNSCLLAESKGWLLVANLHKEDNLVHVALQQNSPFAMVECKRVGVEEGCKKGPQTIEKAKQGAYVAQMTSSLQKVWIEGQRYGLVYKDGQPLVKPYERLLDDVIRDKTPLHKFILSIGNVFTKTKIDKNAHDALCRYFSDNIEKIEGWFNVIAPENHGIGCLKDALNTLKDKDWRHNL